MRRLPPLVTGLVLLPLLTIVACQNSEAPDLQPADAAPQQVITPSIWVVKDLGPGLATAINKGATVVGVNGANQPFRYARGVLTTLPLLPGTIVGRANGINNRGDVVGTAQPAAGASKGWFLPAGSSVPIEIVPPAGGSDVSPSAVNSAGLVVGQYLSAAGWSAFKWGQSFGFVDLHVAGALADSAADVNDKNTIVGWVNHTGHCDTRARSFTLADLVSLATSACTAHAEGVNNADIIVGFSSTANSPYPLAVKWTNRTTIVNLNFGGVASEAHAISDSGRAVGYRQPAIGQPLLPLTLYKGSLQKLPILGGAGGYSDAVAVNNCGLVAGFAIPVGTSLPHAVIWQRTSLGRPVACAP